jgi:hypothetical protein
MTSLRFAAPAAAAPSTQLWQGITSENGWPIQNGLGNPIPAHKIQGSDAIVAVLPGAVATVLGHVARRFHYEIDTLRTGDLRGHTTDRTVTAPFESNYLSGTAIAIFAHRYPVGVRGGLFPHEEKVVRDILAECHGVVRWGGDNRTAPQESHFQIDVAPGDSRLDQVAARIDVSDVGAPADPFASDRLRAANDLARHQRATAK